MNNPIIKYDRRQSLKIIDNSTYKKKIPLKKSIELLQMKLLSKRNLSNTPNKKNSEQRRVSLSTKVSSEECKLSSNLSTPKNISQTQIPFSDKIKSKVLNTCSSNKPLQTIEEIVPNEKESKNSPVRTIKRLSRNNYILYINECAKKINFQDELKNFVENEEKKSICSILNDPKESKPKNSDTLNNKIDINNKVCTEPKLDFLTPTKKLFNRYDFNNSVDNSKFNISREESFQKIKKAYFSPFIYSRDFPKVSLKNKYLNHFFDKTDSTKTGKIKIDNIYSINTNKEDEKNNSENETAEIITKTENILSSPFNLSSYLNSNKKELLNESISRCYNNIINVINNEIDQVSHNQNCSKESNNKKQLNNIFKNNRQRIEYIKPTNSFKNLDIFGEKNYYGNTFINYNRNKNSNLYRLLK